MAKNEKSNRKRITSGLADSSTQPVLEIVSAMRAKSSCPQTQTVMQERKSMKKQTQQIGAAGELLVQYKLIKNGIDSARLTTDAGIDLVAYSPKTLKSYSIQVKTTDRPVRAGGKGKLALCWFLNDNSSADIIAVTDLSENRVWLFTNDEFKRQAQQHSEKNIRQLYMYVEDPIRTKHEKVLVSSSEEHLFENKYKSIF